MHKYKSRLCDHIRTSYKTSFSHNKHRRLNSRMFWLLQPRITTSSLVCSLILKTEARKLTLKLSIHFRTADFSFGTNGVRLKVEGIKANWSMGNLVSMFVNIYIYIYLYMCQCMCLCVDMYMCMNMIVSCMFICAHTAFVCTLWLCTQLWRCRQCWIALYKLDVLLLLLLLPLSLLLLLLFLASAVTWWQVNKV